MLKKSKLWNTFIQMPESGVVLGIIGLLIILSITGRNWFTVYTFRSIFKTSATLGIITIGQALLITGGEIDLSVGSVYAFIGLMYTWLIRTLMPVGAVSGLLLAFLITIMLGIAIGLFHAVLVTRFKIPSLIATLGSMFIFRGIANGIGKGWGLPFPRMARMNVLSRILGESNFKGFNISILWLIIITIIFTIVLLYTRYGNHLQAVGRDPITVLSVGISPAKIKLIAFIVCAVLVSFTAMLDIADSKYAYSAGGQGFPLESIAAAVLGGCSIAGGIGSIWGAVLGVFLLSSVRTGLIMMGAPPYWYITFVGIVLILMMLVKTKRRIENI
jgi:ribose/xylose/arabinose/galactoside ABC-type transport system permease subunit